jgi:hypothetical protein
MHSSIVIHIYYYYYYYYYYTKRDCVVGVATRLQTGRSGVRIPAKKKTFFALQNLQIGSSDHTTSSSEGTGVEVKWPVGEA